jgi:Uncharacterized protein conserved in bacteria (DUF2219)
VRSDAPNPPRRPRELLSDGPPSLLCVVMLVACVGTAHADGSSTTASSGERRSTCWPAAAENQSSEPESTALGGGIVLDEHLLTNGSRDQDYNGGGELMLSGGRAGLLGRTLDRALGFIDEGTCPQTRFVTPGWHATHAFAAGLLVFTPRDLRAREVVPGDRSYASLFFLSVGRRYTSPDALVAYDSSLTVGMLGLAAAGSVQRALHSATSSVKPEGWQHQSVSVYRRTG